MKLSVIMPVYNEKDTIRTIVEKVKAVPIEKELIIVDDCSTDSTTEILQTLCSQQVKVIRHSENKGKGAAVRTGLRHASGDIVIIQDADLEYDPGEYPKLISPILEGEAEVVYGSRFMGKKTPYSQHYWANRFLTLLMNLLYCSSLTDMEVCYKVFRADIIKSIQIKSNRFDLEPEITAKVLKRKYRIFEVPVSYVRRSRKEGKKIGWKDGLAAVYTLIRFRFRD